MKPVQADAPSPAKPRRPAEWPLPTALILLSLIPSLGGVARLVSLGDPSSGPEDARFLAAPLPVILHIASALPYSILGAFQFSTGFRMRRPQWHRTVGKGLLVAGMVSALSGLWMTVFYPIPAPLQGPLLYGVRLLTGVGMAVSLWLAWTTIRQRNVPAHRAWMIRAYAIAQGAGTQAVVLLPYMLLIGQPDTLTRDVLMTLSWGINLLVAEWVIRRPRRRLPLNTPTLQSPV